MQRTPAPSNGLRLAVLGLAWLCPFALAAPLVPRGTASMRGPVQAAGCEPSWLPAFGAQPGLDGDVFALAVFDDGTGPALYAGGYFTTAGGVPANYIAKWNGTSWSALGSGTNSGVAALAVFDDGSGPALYAGGEFTSAGGAAANGLAKWNGATWAALPSEVSSPFGAAVSALTVFDDGGGPALYAGGYFTAAGGVPASCIAKWNGTTWAALGAGVGAGKMTPIVSALTVFDDGGGPELYVGGVITSAGPVPAAGIAKWDGTSWSALGFGVDGVFPFVYALAVFDDGSGPALYAGGPFTSAAPLGDVNGIAQWDGTSWSALGWGVDGFGHAYVGALTVFDDGSGPALYAGGRFTHAGFGLANAMAKWNGATWSALGSGVGGGEHPWVSALTVFDDGTGPALYAGGGFTESPAGDSYLAKWGCPPPISSVPGCAGNPATLAALATSAPLGTPLPLLITASAAMSGVGAVYFGAAGLDGSGCGLFVPGLGELLLAWAPPPVLVASGVLAAGTCALAPVVPSIPALSGVTVHLQGAAVHLLTPQLIEPTNALAVTLGP